MFPEDKTPFKFYNITPFSPGNEELLAQEMIEYQQRTGNDTVLYSLTLHPEGYPASRKVEIALESYRKLKRHWKAVRSNSACSSRQSSVIGPEQIRMKNSGHDPLM